MPINKNLKLGFIHIPKTAGTTVETALDMKSLDCFYSLAPLPGYEVCPQHFRLSELYNLVSKPDSYSWFTIVRNPFDRVVSEYHYMLKYKAYHPKFRNISFSDFIKFCVTMPAHKRQVSFDRHLEPQSFFIDLNVPMNVFRYENLQELFIWLNDITARDLQFLRCLPSDREKDYKHYFNDSELVDIVTDVYAEDMSKFGYTY